MARKQGLNCFSTLIQSSKLPPLESHFGPINTKAVRWTQPIWYQTDENVLGGEAQAKEVRHLASIESPKATRANTQQRSTQARGQPRKDRALHVVPS